MNELGPERTTDCGPQLLSLDNKFFKVLKRLMEYNEYSMIAKKLHFSHDH